jgi:hypothetical protein
MERIGRPEVKLLVSEPVERCLQGASGRCCGVFDAFPIDVSAGRVGPFVEREPFASGRLSFEWAGLVSPSVIFEGQIRDEIPVEPVEALPRVGTERVDVAVEAPVIITT